MTTKLTSAAVAIGLLCGANACDGEPTEGLPEAGAAAPSSQPAAARDMSIHLHHVHLASADRTRSQRFYEEFLGARPVRLDGGTATLHTPPILLLIDESATPRSTLPSALQHVGWGSKDVGSWYASAHAHGVLPDTRGNSLFKTDEQPTIGAPGSGPSTIALLGLEVPDCFPLEDALSYMYVLGPDQERIEVWSGVDRRVNHVHFTTADLAATANWYQRFLGVPITNGTLFAGFFLDDILFFFEPIGDASSYRPTDDHVMNHIAFSVADLAAWRQRALEQQVEVIREPAQAHGFDSLFVRGPDQLLIELVQAAPLPELCPDAP